MRLKRKWREKSRSMGENQRSTEHFYLLCEPEGSFVSLNLRFNTSKCILISILSYIEKNGVRAAIQLSSRLLGIKIQQEWLRFS